MIRLLGRFARDESGMTMGLAIITVVLIGVMGAGLLTFVMTDLNSVVEVNQGQRAFELADSGVQIARQQIYDDRKPSNYTGSGPSSDWAPTGDPNTSGKIINIDDAEVRVTIEPDPSYTSVVMFRVVSEGINGFARRKVEALISAPEWGAKAYFTPGDIFIDQDVGAANPLGAEPEWYRLIDRVDIRGVSVFSGGDVIISDNWGMSERGNNVWGYGTNNTNYVTTPYPFLCTGTGFRNYASCEPPLPSRFEDANLPQPHIRIVGNAGCPELVNRWSTEGAFDSATSPGYQADVLGDWYKPPYNNVRRSLDNTRYCEDGLETFNGPLGNEGNNTITYYAGDTNLQPDPYPAVSADPTGNKFRRYHTASIAAEGLICRASDYAPDNDCDNSIADVQPGDALGGSDLRLGFDSSTLDSPKVPGFYKKPDGYLSEPPAGRADDLTYPFVPQVPNVEELRQMALGQSTPTRSNRYLDLDVAADRTVVSSAAGWRNIYQLGNLNTETVVFIDAGGRDIELPSDATLVANPDKSFPRQGILVVRCGNLTNLEEFQGLIILLDDAGPGDSATTCANKGNYRAGKAGGREYNNEIDVNGYVYAEGDGDPTSTDGSDVGTEPDYKYGIYIADGANIDRLDPLHRGLPTIVGSGGEGGIIESWRECYSSTLNAC